MWDPSVPSPLFKRMLVAFQGSIYRDHRFLGNEEQDHSALLRPDHYSPEGQYVVAFLTLFPPFTLVLFFRGTCRHEVPFSLFLFLAIFSHPTWGEMKGFPLDALVPMVSEQ